MAVSAAEIILTLTLSVSRIVLIACEYKSLSSITKTLILLILEIFETPT